MVGTLISVEEYLHTTYDPDCDYVDGEVLERNMGDQAHSTTQVEFAFYFRSRREDWNVFVFTEQRIRVTPSRYRIADLCVYAGQKPKEPVFQTPPFLCIEILSPDDRIERIQDRIDDYLKFGVPYVWVVNPRSRRGWIYTTDEILEAKDGVLRTENPAYAVPLAEIFAAFDRK
ncbi:MAG: Uma2 family endonuclease [Bryobacterales bacterium]|nr:Uma2 family endonuclease [Bryobacterales bacterium]MBV9397079.1 Uma2 family endonuclease [Bryobacterales bacterium]